MVKPQPSFAFTAKVPTLMLTPPVKVEPSPLSVSGDCPLLISTPGPPSVPFRVSEAKLNGFAEGELPGEDVPHVRPGRRLREAADRAA